MTTAAPRIRPALLKAIGRFDNRTIPIAEVCRRVGTEADRLGLTRPSYERVRELVHLLRRPRMPRPASPMLELFLEAGVGLRAGPRVGVGFFARVNRGRGEVEAQRERPSNSLLQA